MFPRPYCVFVVGKKYEIVRLHAGAIDMLSFEFPSTLAGLDATRKFEPMSKIWYRTFTRIDSTSMETLMVVINLAREAETFKFLPAAYYRYCETYGFDAILDTL
jgi:hypothetical protein